MTPDKWRQIDYRLPVSCNQFSSALGPFGERDVNRVDSAIFRVGLREGIPRGDAQRAEALLRVTLRLFCNRISVFAHMAKLRHVKTKVNNYFQKSLHHLVWPMLQIAIRLGIILLQIRLVLGIAVP